MGPLAGVYGEVSWGVVLLPLEMILRLQQLPVLVLVPLEIWPVKY